MLLTRTERAAVAGGEHCPQRVRSTTDPSAWILGGSVTQQSDNDTGAFKDPPGNGDSTFKSPSRELTGSENLCPLPTQGPLHPSSRTCLHGISEIGRDYNSRGGLDQNMLLLPFERKSGILACIRKLSLWCRFYYQVTIG